MKIRIGSTASVIKDSYRVCTNGAGFAVCDPMRSDALEMNQEDNQASTGNAGEGSFEIVDNVWRPNEQESALPAWLEELRSIVSTLDLPPRQDHSEVSKI